MIERILMTDDSSTVISTAGDGVVTLVLNRPEKRNAMNGDMDQRLRRLVQEANDDDACRVIVITGAGSAFCSGTDRSPGGPPQDGEGWDAIPPSIARSRFGYLLESRKPVIAAINGVAIGAGLVLACSCTVRVVASKAMLSFPYVALGLIAEYGIAKLLPALIGYSHASELLVSGRRFDGTEAWRMGLAQYCVDANEVMPFANDYARNLAARASPRSLRVTLAQLRHSSTQTLEQSLAEAGMALRDARESADYREAKVAAAEKRAPQFTGN